MSMNRLFNFNSPLKGDEKRVLAPCSAGREDVGMKDAELLDELLLWLREYDKGAVGLSIQSVRHALRWVDTFRNHPPEAPKEREGEFTGCCTTINGVRYGLFRHDGRLDWIKLGQVTVTTGGVTAEHPHPYGALYRKVTASATPTRTTAPEAPKPDISPYPASEHAWYLFDCPGRPEGFQRFWRCNHYPSAIENMGAWGCEHGCHHRDPTWDSNGYSK